MIGARLAIGRRRRYTPSSPLSWGVRRHQGRGNKMTDKTCSIHGCGNIPVARGLCPSHYSKWRKTHNLLTGKLCSVPGCNGPQDGNGMCGKHAQRVRRYGDANYVTPENIRIENNRNAQPKLGQCVKTTYKKLHGRHEHRRVMEAYLGRILNRNEIVHHIDGNKHNNSVENLIVVTQSEHCKLHKFGGKKALT